MIVLYHENVYHYPNFFIIFTISNEDLVFIRGEILKFIYSIYDKSLRIYTCIL